MNIAMCARIALPDVLTAQAMGISTVDSPSADNPRPAGPADALRGLRKKLAKLNAVAAATTATPASAAAGAEGPAIVYRRDLPREAPRPPREDPGICLPLETCVVGLETASPRGPAFYLIESPAAIAGAVAPGLAEALPRAVEAFSQAASVRLGVEEVCFLDLETTGLGTALTFLIGTLVWRDGGLVCRQLLARTYAEEASIIAAFADQARRTPLFVTFNGKTFDVPSLRARAAATGVALAEPPYHLDLLHEARRVYKDLVPDCRLQTLERCICRRHRVDDIAGADIGRAYHDFVRTGDARELALIVKHNERDLLTMAELMARMLLTRDP